MNKILSVIVFLTIFLTGLALAQNISGTYLLNAQASTLTLILEQDAQGNIHGTLSGTTGARYQVEGMIQDGVGVGACYNNQGGSFFEAHPQGNQLLFALIEPGADNMPDYNKVKQLMFTKKQSGKPGKQGVLDHQGQPGKKIAARTDFQKSQTEMQSSSSKISSQEIGDPNWGFKFKPPNGWKHRKDHTGALLGHDTIPGMILVFPHQARNMQTMTQQMQEGLVEEGVSLVLSSKLHRKGNNVLWGECTGMVQGQQAKGQAIGTLSPHGGGAYILAVSTPDKFGKDIANAANTIAGRMKYFKLDVSDLMQHFSSTWVHISKSGSTLINLILNNDGSFERVGETSYSGNYSSSGWTTPDTNWGATGASQNQGRWTVRGDKNQGQLVLNYFDGRQEIFDYKIHYARGRTWNSQYYFNGVYYFRKEAYNRRE